MLQIRNSNGPNLLNICKSQQLGSNLRVANHAAFCFKMIIQLVLIVETCIRIYLLLVYCISLWQCVRFSILSVKLLMIPPPPSPPPPPTLPTGPSPVNRGEEEKVGGGGRKWGEGRGRYGQLLGKRRTRGDPHIGCMLQCYMLHSVHIRWYKSIRSLK